MPRGGLFLIAGADVQKDRIEADVWAWGRGLESWLIDHIVIEGGPERARAWDELSACFGIVDEPIRAEGRHYHCRFVIRADDLEQGKPGQRRRKFAGRTRT